MTTESKKIERLLAQPQITFPERGQPLAAPCAQGVYIIRKDRRVMHVGRTVRGKKGLYQRLRNHLSGQSSFTKTSLGGRGHELRGVYTYQYLEVEDARQRALVECYAAGVLCPAHLGVGQGSG